MTTTGLVFLSLLFVIVIMGVVIIGLSEQLAQFKEKGSLK